MTITPNELLRSGTSQVDLRRARISKMSDKVPVPVLSCELDNGYAFKNCFGFISALRGRPVITFLADKMVAPNRTFDDQVYGNSSLYGDEINLAWDDNIPVQHRNLSLTFDATRIQATFGRIKKKDQARIIITQTRDSSDPYNFDGPNSSNDFNIYISSGTGGDGREGIRCIAATRTRPDDTLIKYPEKNRSSLMVIPARSFRQMIDSFAKCKKDSIRIKYYMNSRYSNGQEYKGRPGILLTTDAAGQSGGIIEKFGDVPDEDPNAAKAGWSTPALQLSGVKIDESAIVRPTASSQVIIEVEKPPEPNEFSFTADKIQIFAKLASMHNEGNVRIYYQPGCHLRIAHRYGAFGECEICLSNIHVREESRAIVKV